MKKGNLNFLVSDYLSEITMSLLTAAKRKSPVSVHKVTRSNCTMAILNSSHTYVHVVMCISGELVPL